MSQRFDLLAMCFLLFAAVFASWIAAGPMKFELREWQTLIAALVALGAASLAYKSAMAKVKLDRELADRSERRKVLGICLRLEYNLRVLQHEAKLILLKIPEFTASKKGEIRTEKLGLGARGALDEAWTNLDAFSRDTSYQLAQVRAALYNYESLLVNCGATSWSLNQGENVPAVPRELRGLAIELAEYVEPSLQSLKREIKKLS